MIAHIYFIRVNTSTKIYTAAIWPCIENQFSEKSFGLAQTKCQLLPNWTIWKFRNQNKIYIVMKCTRLKFWFVYDFENNI